MPIVQSRVSIARLLFQVKICLQSLTEIGSNVKSYTYENQAVYTWCPGDQKEIAGLFKLKLKTNFKLDEYCCGLYLVVGFMVGFGFSFR
jgi:hypothetical protein